jgi:adenine-specific DNA methylase
MPELRYQKTDVIKCKHCGEFTPIYDNIFKAKKHRADLEGKSPRKKSTQTTPADPNAHAPATAGATEPETPKPTEKIENENKTFW